MRATNLHFATNDEIFKLSCDLAKIKPTARQASRYRRGKGLAYGFRTEAINALKALETEEKN